MPLNRLNNKGQRTQFRKNAWGSTCGNCLQWLTLGLTICSSGLSLARSQIDDNEEVTKILFSLEWSIGISSYVLQYILNIYKIETLRLLHDRYSQMNQAAYVNGDNGLTAGISVPSNIGLGIGLGGSLASAVTFFKASTKTSAIIDVATPIISNAINSLARTRLEIEENELEHITDGGPAIDQADRNTCGMITRILTFNYCRRCRC